jgi:hypothetical protein
MVCSLDELILATIEGKKIHLLFLAYSTPPIKNTLILKDNVIWIKLRTMNLSKICVIIALLSINIY